MDAFIAGVVGGLRAVFDPRAAGIALAELLSRLVIAAITFIAFYLLWRLLDRIAAGLLRRGGVDATNTSFALTALKFVLLTLAAVQALAAAGINTAALVASLGIAGLTFGFAARDALSNLISGILIFWDRPFVIGDLVEVGGQYGRVERITLRSTRVVTSDGRMLAVPNSTIINSTVTSYTNFPHLRIEVEVGIGLDEDMEKVRGLLLDLVRDDPDFMQTPAPAVVLKTLGSYSNTVQLLAWISDERRHLEKRSGLRELVYRSLQKAGVSMPVETLKLLPVEVATVASKN